MCSNETLLICNSLTNIVLNSYTVPLHTLSNTCQMYVTILVSVTACLW